MRLEVLEHGLHLIRPGGVFAEAGLPQNGHARVVAYLLQLRGEDAQGVLFDGALGREAGNGPDTDLHACNVIYSKII